jgi:aspartyl protease family protein
MSVLADNSTGGGRKQRSRMFDWTVRVAGVAIAITVVASAVLSMVGSRAGAPGAAVSKSAPVATAVLEFPRDSDGRYYVDAEINDRKIRFIVDPSARATVLGRDDAQSVGIDAYDLKFTDHVATAGGEAAAAPVTVREFRIRTLTLFDAKLEVADRSLPSAIAGKSFLDRFSGYELQQDKLVLRQ